METKQKDFLHGLAAEDVNGSFGKILADEEPLDRRTMWNLGAWACVTLGALTLAFLTAQTSITLRRDVAQTGELTRQNRQLASAVSERELEARRLASAVDTLNADRDRLYARVTGLEQNLDSVTGAIKRQAAATMVAPAPAPLVPPPAVSAPASVVVAVPPKSEPARPSTDEPALSLDTTAAIPSPQQQAAVLPEIPVVRTEFGVDLGTANSIEGLRALWRSKLAKHKDALASLRPIVALKERGALGMQLRLVAGPLSDAAAAARICAKLGEGDRTCEMTAFDGQRLAMASPAAGPGPAQRPRPTPRPRPAATAPAEPPAAQPAQSGLSSFLNRN